MASKKRATAQRDARGRQRTATAKSTTATSTTTQQLPPPAKRTRSATTTSSSHVQAASAVANDNGDSHFVALRQVTRLSRVVQAVDGAGAGAGAGVRRSNVRWLTVEDDYMQKYVAAPTWTWRDQYADFVEWKATMAARGVATPPRSESGFHQHLARLRQSPSSDDSQTPVRSESDGEPPPHGDADAGGAADAAAEAKDEAPRCVSACPQMCVVCTEQIVGDATARATKAVLLTLQRETDDKTNVETETEEEQGGGMSCVVM